MPGASDYDAAQCQVASVNLVGSVELRTFVLLPREVRVILNNQGLFSPDHLKSLLSWVLVSKAFLNSYSSNPFNGRFFIPGNGPEFSLMEGSS
jgi:hypothetical protein